MPKDYRVEKWTGNSAPSAAELKRRMEDEGFSVFQWSDPPGATYSPHVHSDAQSHWIVSGTLELEVTVHELFSSKPAIVTSCRPILSTRRR